MHSETLSRHTMTQKVLLLVYMVFIFHVQLHAQQADCYSITWNKTDGIKHFGSQVLQPSVSWAHGQINHHLIPTSKQNQCLYLVHYHTILQSITDLIRAWNLQNAIFFIDRTAGINEVDFRRFLSVKLPLQDVAVVMLEARTDYQQTFSKISTDFNNYVAVCNHYVLKKLIQFSHYLENTKKLHSWMFIVDTFYGTDLSNVISRSFQSTVFVPIRQEIRRCNWFNNEYSGLLAMSQVVNIYDAFYSPTANRIQFIRTATWNIHSGLFMLEILDEADNIKKLQQQQIRLGGFVHLPYATVENQGNTTLFRGYMVDILDILMEYFNTRYTIKQLPQLWGIAINGSYTGLLLKLFLKEVDVAINGFSKIIGRLPAITYLAPMSKIDISIAYKTPPSFVSPASYVYPFDTTVWTLLFSSATIMIILLAIVMWYSPNWKIWDFPSVTIHKSCFRILTGTFFDEVLEEAPGPAAKVIYGTMLILVMGSFIFYTSVFTSFLAHKNLKLPFNTLDDVVEDNEYRCVVIKNTIYEDMPARAVSGLYKRFWDRKLKPNLAFSLQNSIHDSVRRMYEGKTVFVGDGASIIEEMDNDCSVTVIRTLLMRDDLYLVTRKDFPYSRIFYIRLLKIKEGGLISRLGIKYRTVKRPPCSVEEGDLSLGLREVTGLFFILFLGILTASVVTGLEYRIYSRHGNSHQIEN